MEIIQTLELTTPIGIATMTTLLVELIKKRFVPNLDKGNRFYYAIVMGMSLAVSGLLSWVALPIFGITPMDALYNWVYGWMGATFGFQVLKTATKMIKKDQK